MSKKKTGTGTRMSNEPEEMVGDAAISLPVIELALDKIRVDESKNLRRFAPDAKAINELAESIKQEGLLQPVIVRPIEVNGDGAEYELVAGFRRMQALRVNQSESVSARVVGGTSDNKIINLTENRMRAELSPMDAAHAASELVASGMKKQDVGKAFGKSPAWTTRVLKFLTLRPAIQKQIHEGEIAFRVAIVLPDLTEEKQDALLSDIAKRDKDGDSATEKATKAKSATGKKGKQGRKKKKAKKLAADPAVKEAAKYKKIHVSVVKAHSQLCDKVKKAKKKATEKDKAMVTVLGALRGCLDGKPLEKFTAAVGKLL